MREVISISINLDSLFENKNGVIFTEEAKTNAMKSLSNIPITIREENDNYEHYEDMYSERAIGVITNVSDGFLWCELEPEMKIIEMIERNDKKVVTSFEFNALSLKI